MNTNRLMMEPDAKGMPELPAEMCAYCGREMLGGMNTDRAG